MISLKNIHKVYNSGKANQVIALQNVSLTVPAGEFLVIVGSNGSGKSTLLNVIAGSFPPTSGKVFIDNNDVTNEPDYRRSKWIARVFQNPLSGTAADLSILDNFRLAALRTKRKALNLGTNAAFRKKVEGQVSLLELGLEQKLDQAMGTLSGGQRQALTLLMSVIDDCKILLLDEPTAALDPRSADIVMKTADRLIREHQLTAILITHNLKDAFTYGDRVIQMSDGSILRDIPKSGETKLKQTDLFEWFT